MDNIQFKEPTAYAFPSDNTLPPSDGMTLRDWFAGQALTTIAGYSAEYLSTWHTHDFAAHAYAIADAMLDERNKGN